MSLKSRAWKRSEGDRSVQVETLQALFQHHQHIATNCRKREGRKARSLYCKLFGLKDGTLMKTTQLELFLQSGPTLSESKAKLMEQHTSRLLDMMTSDENQPSFFLQSAHWWPPMNVPIMKWINSLWRQKRIQKCWNTALYMIELGRGRASATKCWSAISLVQNTCLGLNVYCRWQANYSVLFVAQSGASSTDTHTQVLYQYLQGPTDKTFASISMNKTTDTVGLCLALSIECLNLIKI